MQPSAGTGSSSSSRDGPRPTSSSKPERSRRHFVAEADRRRASRACDGCRRTKEKCEGGVPCNRCVRTRRQCHFSPASTFELSRPLKGPNTHPDQVERLKLLEQIAQHFLGPVPLDLTNLRQIGDSLQLEKPTLTEEDGNGNESDDPEEYDLEEEAYTVKTLSGKVAHYSGEFSHWNFSERVLKRVDESLGAEDNEVRAPILEYYRPTQLQSPTITLFTIGESLPPQDVVEFLLRLFFKFADPCYFYVEERVIRQLVSVLRDDPQSVTSNDSSWVCTVLMVLAVGAQYAHLADGLSQDAQPDSTAPESLGNRLERDVGMNLYHVASKLLPDVIAIASLDSVQACLLLGAYTLTVDTQGIAYTFVGLAVMIAIQNGLHRRYSGPELDAHTVELRNRLWWTAYTLEKRICILHGRPGTVAITDTDAELPVESVEFDSEENSRFPNMSALIYLTIRLGDISHAITLLRRCPKRLQPNYFGRLLEIRKQLQKWWSELPRPSEILPTDPLFRSHIHLKLCFHLNQIFMGRPFIFTSSGRSSNRSESGASPPPLQTAAVTTPSGESHRGSKVALLISDAVSAALTIVELCSLLDAHEGLARASYIEFSSCRAALLLLLAQSLNERTGALRDAIGTGIQLLRRCTTGNVSHKSDVSIIEALDAGVHMLHAEQDGASSASRRSETGYDRFKSWANLWKSGVGVGGGADTVPSQAASTGVGPVIDGQAGVSTASAAGSTAHLTGLDMSYFNLNPGFDFNAPLNAPPATGFTQPTDAAYNVPIVPPESMADIIMFNPAEYVNGAEFLDDEWQWNPMGFDSLDTSFPLSGQPPQATP